MLQGMKGVLIVPITPIEDLLRNYWLETQLALLSYS